MAGFRRQFDPVPPGWEACPCIGEVAELHHLIPMKVPLGATRRFPDMLQRTRGHWCPAEAMRAAHEKITAKNPAGILSMVLDLSNSDKYYDPQEFIACNLRYVKVPCRGRGQSPNPLAVNMAVWEVRKALAQNPNAYILVHCTHGYNRSGFIIVSAAMRLLAEAGWCVERLLRRYAEQRPPGIYKHDYITDLFKRHNERRPACAVTPPLPNWKPADDEDEDEQLLTPVVQQSARMTHSDKVGEAVSLEEARWVLNIVYDILQAQDMMLNGKYVTGFPHAEIQHRSPGDAVIGSQPVSLDRQNLVLLRMKRYFVTWKADGTRYLILLTRFGTYLVDRAGEVRRVHMRFPSRLPPPADGKRPAHPVGPPHEFTLLDGEMVVDDEDFEGLKQRRRLLIYDAMMLAGEGISDLRFQDRYKLIEKEVVRPRKEEMDFYSRHPVPNFLYDWGLEPFGVRRKEFWPLDKARSLLIKFIPTLCHESDGLIFQPWDDPYIPRTFPHLLKWKFQHLNSVDFKVFAVPGRPPALQLNCAMRRKRGAVDIDHRSLSDIGLGEQPVVFTDGVDPVKLHGKIVECSFDQETRTWTYMRDRPDKTTANHRSVFEKVMASIIDNITEADILAVCDEALKLDLYKEEQLWRTGQHPSQLQAQLQKQQQQQQQQQQQHGGSPVPDALPPGAPAPPAAGAGYGSYGSSSGGGGGPPHPQAGAGGHEGYRPPGGLTAAPHQQPPQHGGPMPAAAAEAGGVGGDCGFEDDGPGPEEGGFGYEQPAGDGGDDEYYMAEGDDEGGDADALKGDGEEQEEEEEYRVTERD